MGKRREMNLKFCGKLEGSEINYNGGLKKLLRKAKEYWARSRGKDKGRDDSVPSLFLEPF